MQVKREELRAWPWTLDISVIYLWNVFILLELSQNCHTHRFQNNGMQLGTLNWHGRSENTQFLMITPGHTVTCRPMVRSSIVSKPCTKLKAAFSKRRIVICRWLCSFSLKPWGPYYDSPINACKMIHICHSSRTRRFEGSHGPSGIVVCMAAWTCYKFFSSSEIYSKLAAFFY